MDTVSCTHHTVHDGHRQASQLLHLADIRFGGSRAERCGNDGQAQIGIKVWGVTHLSEGTPELLRPVAERVEGANGGIQRWQARVTCGLQPLQQVLHVVAAQQGIGMETAPAKAWLRLAVSSATRALWDPVPMNRK